MSETQRIAIIGAGPIGLEAAAVARHLAYPTTVYETGDVANNVLGWGHTPLYTPFAMNHSAAGARAIAESFPRHTLPDADEMMTGRAFAEQYLLPLARSAALVDAIKTRAQVREVAREGLRKHEGIDDPRRGERPFRVLSVDAEGNEFVDHAEIVIDCSGTYGNHNWLGNGGIPAVGERLCEDRIDYGVEDIAGVHRQRYIGRQVLLVGDTLWAAMSLLALAELARRHPRTRICWITPTDRQPPVPMDPDDPLPARRAVIQAANGLADAPPPFLRYENRTHVEAIERAEDGALSVTVSQAGEQRQIMADRIVANVGYKPDTRLFSELHVQLCYATCGPINLAAALRNRPPGPHADQMSFGPDVLLHPERNFFVLGSKSYGRHPGFLIKAGLGQVRDLFAHLTGRPDLHLEAS